MEENVYKYVVKYSVMVDGVWMYLEPHKYDAKESSMPPFQWSWNRHFYTGGNTAHVMAACFNMWKFGKIKATREMGKAIVVRVKA